MLKVNFLGTGTSQGVPVIACQCEVCQSEDSRDKRLRSSVWIQSDNASLVIDTGPDFRQQMLRANVRSLDAVLFTHEHKDHIAGLDDVRAFNFIEKRPMDIYASRNVQIALKREFHYVFSEDPYPGIPQVQVFTIDEDPIEIGDLSITPIEVMHYKLPVLGFRIGDFTYITDTNFIPEKARKLIAGSKVLVLNALRKSHHMSHFTLEEAIQVASEIGADQTFFTHISHLLGKHSKVSKELPDGIYLAYDGLELQI